MLHPDCDLRATGVQYIHLIVIHRRSIIRGAPKTVVMKTFITFFERKNRIVKDVGRQKKTELMIMMKMRQKSSMPHMSPEPEPDSMPSM